MAVPPARRVDELVQRIRGEYLEMPGLRLTYTDARVSHVPPMARTSARIAARDARGPAPRTRSLLATVVRGPKEQHVQEVEMGLSWDPTPTRERTFA